MLNPFFLQHKSGVMPFVVQNGHHPLSIGFKAGLYTDSPLFVEDTRVSAEIFDSVFGENSRKVVHAAMAEFDTIDEVDNSDVRWDVIFVPHSDGLDHRRLCQLLVHEVSHMVDKIFERTGVEACTEVRAYYNDWLFGLYYDLMCDSVPNTPTRSDSTKSQTKDAKL